MEIDPAVYRQLEFYLPLVLIGVLAAVAYLAILAGIHLRARGVIEFYREIGQEVQRQEDQKRVTGDASQLAAYQDVHQAVRKVLEREGLLKKK